MIKPADIPADVSGLLAATLNARLDAYKAEYRAFAQGKLVAVRDGYPDRSPEWIAINKVLLQIGAGPRDPGAAAANVVPLRAEGGGP